MLEQHVVFKRYRAEATEHTSAHEVVRIGTITIDDVFQRSVSQGIQSLQYTNNILSTKEQTEWTERGVKQSDLPWSSHMLTIGICEFAIPNNPCENHIEYLSR